MSEKHTFILGVKPDGTVNTVASMAAFNVMNCLVNGETVIPCTYREAQALLGKKVMEPLNLQDTIAKTGAAS
jgi:hypothetical protein